MLYEVITPPKGNAKITLITASGSEEIYFAAVDQYTLQADAFAEAILKNKSVPTPLADAIGNMAIIDAIKLSAEKNNWVTLI